jgi:hypothetical protein
VFNATFSYISSYIMVTSFSGGGSRSTQREPPTLVKQLVNFITCGCESSAPFFVIKTDRHDIAEILLKVALNTIKPTNQINRNCTSISN